MSIAATAAAVFAVTMHFVPGLLFPPPPTTYDCIGRIVSGGERPFTITITPGTFYGSGIIEIPATPNTEEVAREIPEFSVSQDEDFYRMTHPGKGRVITVVIDRNSGVSRMTRDGIATDFKCDKTPRHP